MGLTYVVSDIHGRLDLLNICLAAIAADAATGKVVFTGDYIDRGPDSAGVVQRLIDGPPVGWEWTFIRGNHEDMMLTCIGGDMLEWWVGNGGGATLKSYAGDDALVSSHIDWMNELPRLHSDQRRVYTHAGVSEDFSLEQQPEDVTQWYRYPHKADVGYCGKHVVHGHTPMPDGPEIYSNRTNLDTGGFFTGRMVIGVFDDEVDGGPSRLIEASQ